MLRKSNDGLPFFIGKGITMAIYNGHNEDASGNILLGVGNGMTATVESGTTASQAYTKGSYLYYNNRLCKATAAIASGNTLTIGTNISYTSIGSELTSHLRASNGTEFYFDYQNNQYGYNTSAGRGASTFVPFSNFDPSKILHEVFEPDTTSATIYNIPKAVIFWIFADGAGASYHGGYKVFIKEGTRVSLYSDGGDYTRLGYSEVTETSITLTYDTTGSAGIAYYALPY